MPSDQKPGSTPSQQMAQMQGEIERLRHELRENQEAYATLAAQEARYRSLMELAADAIFLGDTQGNITAANASALILTGYEREELIGRNISCLFSDEERAIKPLRYDLVKAGKVVLTERNLSRKDGSTVPVAMNSKMMPDETYHTAMRDISKSKHLEGEMNAAHRELERFVYTISHDLRTPLAAIIGFAEFLQNEHEKQWDGQTEDILREIEKAGTKMLKLLEDLLCLATAGRLERPQSPVPATEVVNSVLTELKSHLNNAGIEVSVGQLPSLHVPETFLTQIFSNLIGNALRYATGTNDCIRIDGQKQGNVIRFFVQDRGRGISEKERSRIFEAFFRGENTQKADGSGLGLAIVQKVAQAYGGKAWLEDTPGGGSTFWVEMEDVPPVHGPLSRE
ncbi:PAS domain-containing sensor histidine kinase [Desulfuromonas sp. AOP6]|uniref:sensor histidine kinase n=1 Tax=Desulfuromonas sp. AOP6 TaxID=1566351 RepID=UPI0012812758|nr:PAS domain-containing sensor histidine kinase [Desulfuromonas sp. AOP6]BCA80365.1 hypothetical protein AOP6_2152 [Desulfuromonas sp. AOP6]